MKKITLGAIAALSSLLASAAFAGVVEPPVDLPEPGTLGLLAMGIAGIVAAARLGRRK
jgi:PEP-CTERM motif